MQAEPLSVIKLDASSREAGAFKAADGSLRLATLSQG